MKQISVNVPVFSFSLIEPKTIYSEQSSNHLNHSSSQKNTPLKMQAPPINCHQTKNEIVAHILEIFRPKNPEDISSFMENKKIVAGAITHIFAEGQHQQSKVSFIRQKRKIGFITKRRLSPSLFEDKFHTPAKTDKLYLSTSKNHRNLWSSSITLKRMNYIMSESKFSPEDIQDLRIRSGLKKVA